MHNRRKKISIVDYDPAWPDYYITEQAAVRSALGGLCINTFHIGSTAIPDLCGKPSIDIAAVVQHLSTIHAPLDSLGYQYKGEFNVPLRPFFGKRHPQYSVNLHIYTTGSPELEAQLILRDFLRSHPEIMQQYGNLKKKAAAMPSATEKMANGIPMYNAYKHNFILHTLTLAGFRGLRTCLCGVPDEWGAYHTIRQKALKIMHRTDSHPSNQVQTASSSHLVLYQGAQIVAAAEVGALDTPQPTIGFIGTQDQQHSEVYKTQLLEVITRWTMSKGGNSLITTAPHQEAPFFKQLGFSVVNANGSVTLKKSLKTSSN